MTIELFNTIYQIYWWVIAASLRAKLNKFIILTEKTPFSRRSEGGGSSIYTHNEVRLQTECLSILSKIRMRLRMVQLMSWRIGMKRSWGEETISSQLLLTLLYLGNVNFTLCPFEMSFASLFLIGPNSISKLLSFQIFSYCS